MARNVAPGFTGEWIEIVPPVTIGDWDNATDPTPVTLEINPMSVSEEAQFRRRAIANHDRKDSLTRASDVLADTLTKRVRNVRNYKVRGYEISTGAEFAEHAEQELQGAVFEAIVDVSKLDATLKKTSALRSGSQRQVTQP